MNKNIALYFIIAILSIGIAFSHSDEAEFADAEQIIENKVPCSELTEGQLEHIGDYLMEQIHPGEAHEAMDEMMGGEGSESLKFMHIAMAKRAYCNDYSGMADYGMMGMRGYGTGTNYGGMMNMMGTNLGYGMMGSYGWGFSGVLYFILLIGLIILVYLWIIKLLKDIQGKGKK